MSTSLSDPPVELSIVKSVSTTTAAPVRMTSHSASASREDSIQLCKETSFALQMTLSPGTAILGLMDLPTNPTPVLRKLIDSYSTASVPMPLAKEQIQHLNSEMQNSKKRGDKGARRGSLLNPGARRFSLSMATEASVPIGGPIHELTGSQISFFSAHNKPLKPIRPLTLNERISQAQPKIPTIKRPIITIDPFAEKERLEQEARVNAVIELLEEKRTQYHEQEKEAIHKHLQKSRARLYELEKALTASRQRQEVDKERSRKVHFSRIVNGQPPNKYN